LILNKEDIEEREYKKRERESKIDRLF